ncbi:TPA: NEL-type E3 ubiquitin ligase domain-containing protein [Pseudomonas putida]
MGQHQPSFSGNQVIDGFIGYALPDWLRNASPGQINGLRDQLAAHRLTEQALQASLANLQAPQAFAQPLLEASLQALTTSKIDLSRLHWRERWRTFSLPGNRAYQEHETQVPALERLLQNFHVDASSEPGSGLVHPSATGRLLALAPAQIGAACRTLDVGQRYQTHLDSMLNDDLRVLLARDKRQRLGLSVELDALDGRIASADAQMLRHLVAGKPLRHAGHHTARSWQLSLMGCLVDDALVWSLEDEPLPLGSIPYVRVKGVILYMTDQPIRRFASWEALGQALADDLSQADFHAGFCLRIALHDRARFLQTLGTRLQDPLPDLEPTGLEMSAGVFEGLACRQMERMREDARFVLVPVSQLDQHEHRRRIQSLEQVGLGLLQLAGLFVPVINTVLLAQFIGQTLLDVFEGAHDWARGHQHEALEHLLGVAENLAINAVLAGGVNVVARGFARSGFVEALVPVDTNNGARLWHHDLSLYRVQALPAAATLAENGLYTDGARHWWRHAGDYHEVVQARATDAWQLKRNDGRTGFGPPLHSNGDRAWRLAWHRPQEWPGRQRLLEHLWPEAETFDAQGLAKALDILGFDEAFLRGLVVEQRAMPVLLRDLLQGFTADARINRFFDELAQGAASDNQLWRFCVEQLQASPWSEAEQQEAVEGATAVLRQAMMKHLANSPGATHPQLAVLKRTFPGLPDNYALDLLERCGFHELERMRTQGKLTLRVAEQARATLLDARLGRLLQGLLLVNRYSDELPELVFALLRRHAAWPTQVNFEVRKGADTGALLARLYPQDPLHPSKVMVHGRSGFSVYENGRECEALVESPYGLLETLLAFLPGSHKQRLGWDGPGALGRMRADLLAWLPDTRPALSALVGMREVKPRVQPGRRLPDGRYGYLLSGGHRVQAPALETLRNRLRALYPGFNDAMIERYLVLLGHNPEQAFVALLREEDSYRQLDLSLRDWSERGASAGQQASRRLVADELRRCWQLQGDRGVAQIDGTPGRRLSLIGIPVEELPGLPAVVDFSHVTELVLVNLRLPTLPVLFLSRFHQLVRLNLSNNLMTALPSGLPRLTLLRELVLSRNRLRLDAPAGDVLSGLTQLRVLQLDFNPLTSLPITFERLPRLRELGLRNTGLNHVPQGLLQAASLEHVDLRDNRITEVSAAIRESPLGMGAGLALQGNPVLEPEPNGDLTGNGDADLLARDRWLLNVAAADRAAKAARWQRLQEERNSDAFFVLLEDLLSTSDYRLVREDLERRVWSLIDDMYAHGALREALFDLAAEPRTCVDRVIACFSRLEVQAVVQSTLRGLGAGDGRQARLILGRRLFRLQYLEDHAVREMRRRVGAGQDVDEVEVSLAYRIGLAAQLELPGQPSTMQFEAVAGVSAADLQVARDAVTRAEAGDALITFLAGRDFWLEHLRAIDEQAFLSVEAPFEQRQDALFEQKQQMSSGAWKAALDELARLREQALQDLAMRLTREALEGGAST